ncbi:MAG: 3-keto-disaccharide hydrolase [Candidatus Hydrogenedens sp.]
MCSLKQKFLFLFLFTAIIMFVTSAIADEDDDLVMGNYQGTISGKNWDGKSLRAQVVAQGGGRYRCVLLYTQGSDPEQRAEIKGIKAPSGPAGIMEQDKEKAKRMAEINFDGEVDFKGNFGGKGKVTGQIKNEVFIGTIEQGKEKAKFEMKRVFLQPPTLGQKPPEGAIVLMDGKSLDMWDLKPHWQLVEDGSARTVATSLCTKEEYGDGLYHVEFMCPFMPNETGQARGNSGVYVFGRYEVQVLDSFGDLPADNLCGGIYKSATPKVCASLPPLQWQTYDITFTAPKYDENGKKIKNAFITVYHNGILIHDNVELKGPTPGGVSDQEAPKGVLMLQDHGDAVRYRNIWYKPAN